MNKLTTSIASAALVLSLSVLPLTACSGKSADSGSDSGATQQTASTDVTTWKTLGDAFAIATEDPSYGYDDNYFIAIVKSNDSTYRAVAKMDADVQSKIYELNFEDADYQEQFNDAVSTLELISAEDISSGQLSQDELDAFVGKTYEDLLDDGFAFEYYSYYGGDESAGASMAKGSFEYDVMFNVSIKEEQTEDGGEALKGAAITGIQCTGVSNAALDPTLVQE